MNIENCKHCGGTHFGSSKCPLTEPVVSETPAPAGNERLCAEWVRTHKNCPEFTDVVRANGERAELQADVTALRQQLREAATLAINIGKQRDAAEAQVATLTQERDKAMDAWDAASDERGELRSSLALLSAGVQQIGQEMVERLSIAGCDDIRDWTERLHAFTEPQK